MKWKRVPKENCKQPTTGTYSDWKEILAEEGFHQCVYCAIPEPRFGGIRNFHVEHYRPKSLKRFQKLTNDIRNLYFACAICNTFKGDDWPAEPDAQFHSHCFPDPSKTDLLRPLYLPRWRHNPGTLSRVPVRSRETLPQPTSIYL